MKAVCLCFQVHQPVRLKWYWPSEGYSAGDTDLIDIYFDQAFNHSVFERVCKSYLSANNILKDTNLKCTFNLSGTLLDQCKWNPELLSSFRQLRGTGVEFAASPYYNSLCSLFRNLDEFTRQTLMHREALFELFGVKASTFINTELVHKASIAKRLKSLGFSAVVSEGYGGLEDRGCVFDDGILPFLLQHKTLSDDIMFRFSNTNWSEYPLTASKFVRWIDSMQGDVLTLYIDYASFGERHGSASLDFLEGLPDEFNACDIELMTVKDAVSRFDASFYDDDVDFSRHELKHCLSSHMQHVYFNELKRLDRMEFEREDIHGYLQQVDILSEMNKDRPHPFESAINSFSIISDYARRKV